MTCGDCVVLERGHKGAKRATSGRRSGDPLRPEPEAGQERDKEDMGRSSPGMGHQWDKRDMDGARGITSARRREWPAEGWRCERVDPLKIGFDVWSLGLADPQTGYRNPVEGICRIEAKGRTRGESIRLTTNEWYKAAQLGDTYWLYVVWGPLDNPNPEPLRVRNPVKRLDYAKQEVVAAPYFDVPAQAVELIARGKT